MATGDWRLALRPDVNLDSGGLIRERWMEQKTKAQQSKVKNGAYVEKEDGEGRAPERLHSQTRRRNSGGRTEKYDHVLDQGKNPTSPGVFVRSGLSPKEALTGPSLTQASFFALNL